MEHIRGVRRRKTSAVPAVRRVLEVFDLLANSHRGLSVSEISRRLRLPKSSTHRLLQALEEEQCVQRSQQTGRYYFGSRLFRLNRAALEGLELREQAKPALARLLNITRMTVHMAVLEHNQAVLIEKLEPLSPAPPVGTWIGRAMDVHSTAVGKALVAFLPPEELARQVRADTFVRHNQHTIVNLARLMEDLASVRELGYAVDDEEDELGCRCVGAPIFARDGHVVAAISVVGGTDQFPASRIPELGEQVKQAARSISECLESRPPLLPEDLWAPAEQRA